MARAAGPAPPDDPGGQPADQSHRPQPDRPGNRSPRASTSGTRAATANPQARGDPPMGPTAKRSSEPHEGAADPGTGTPKTATAPRPGGQDADDPGKDDQRRHHGGRQGQRRGPGGRPAGRPGARRARARAMAASTTTTAAAGTKATRTASSRPSPSAARTAWCRMPQSASRPRHRTGAPGGRAPPAAAGYRAENGAVPVARNRQASTHGAPA